MHVVVLLSGGIDSSTLLYELLDRGRTVSPVAFRYGQRHVREVESARLIAESRNLKLGVLDLPTLDLKKPPIPDGHYAEESMRATVCPNRNMVMLSVAASLAINLGAEAVAYAAHGGDHTIYPDCRPAFVYALQETLVLGNWERLELLAPFLWMSKADIVHRGAELGVPFHLTWSCYRGADQHCGTCGTCNERREAFQLAGVSDPTEYRVHG